MALCNVSTGGSRTSELWMEFNSNEELARVKLFDCYSESLLQFATACCIILILVGVPGNLITIVALARYKKVWNATAVFIINLHISNFIFCIFILPMTVMTIMQRHWTHGWIMCRVFAYFKFVLNATSIFTVVAISINRHVIVCHPLLYTSLYKRRNISIMLILIWLLPLALFIAPNFSVWGRYDLDPNGGFCTCLKDKNKRSPKKFLLTVAVLGSCFMILCYARVWWVVMHTAKKFQGQNTRQSDVSTDVRNVDNCDFSSSVNSPTCPSVDGKLTNFFGEEITIKTIIQTPFRLTRKQIRPKVPTSKDKRLCAMIAAVMISFCISHIPVLVTKLVYKEYRTDPMANVSAHIIKYSGNCMNPIIYVLMSKEYRQAYRNLLKVITEKFQRQ